MQRFSAAGILGDTARAIEQANAPAYAPASAAASGHDHAAGAGGDSDEEEVLEEGVVEHGEDVLNRALSLNGWSMSRVFSLMGDGPTRDHLIEHMPYSSLRVGCPPGVVAETRRRLLRTTDSDVDTTRTTRRRRDVTSIPAISLDSAGLVDPWQRRTNESAALASGYGRGMLDGDRQGSVPEGSTWIEAILQLEPVLNVDDDDMHPAEMNARITGYLGKYARARWMSARAMSSAEIDAEERRQSGVTAAAPTPAQ